MAKPTATIVQNWKQGMASAGANYTTGTAAVTSSPMAAAAAQQDKAVANYTNALMSGQWAASLQATTMQYWKAQCAQAASKLAAGATKGATKYQNAIAALQPTYAAMRAASDAAGDDPIAKATAALMVIMAAGKKGKAAGM